MEDDGTITRVERLLGTLPGVRVEWVQPQPPLGRVRFGLAVSDPRTLARLVHLACGINVPVAVEVDWGCSSIGHDDPGCVRYDFRVPVGPGDERLGLLAQLLAEEVG